MFFVCGVKKSDCAPAMGLTCSQVMSPTFTHFRCADLFRRLGSVDGASAGSSTPRWSKPRDTFGQEATGVDQKGCGALTCCRMLEIIAELVLQVDGSDFSQREVSLAVRATGYADMVNMSETFGQMSSCKAEAHVIIVCGEVAHVFLMSLVTIPACDISNRWKTASRADGDTNTTCESCCSLILAGDWMDVHGTYSCQDGPQTIVWHGLDGFTKSSGDCVEVRILWKALANMWANGDVVSLRYEDLLATAAHWRALGALQLSKEAGEVTTMSGTEHNSVEAWCGSSNVHGESSCVHSAVVAEGSSESNFQKAVEYSTGREFEGPLYEEHPVSRISLSPYTVVPSEPSNPEAGLSLSSLEPLDIPNILQSSEISVKHVVGVLNCPLGFRPLDPSVGYNRFDSVASECGVATKGEVGYKGTEEPSIEGGLITHLAAQVSTSPTADPYPVHASPSGNMDEPYMVFSMIVDGLSPGQVLETNNEGRIFEDGFKGHNSRGEASVPATPVLSATEAGFDDSTNAAPAPLSVVNVPHVSSNQGSRVVMEGHGVKANKNTIPKCAPVFPSIDPGDEAVEMSELAGGNQPKCVVCQPVGFRPEISDPLVAFESLGSRPELLASGSSSTGCRQAEARVGQQGGGCPIHVEPRESTSGETFEEKSEVCDFQRCLAQDQWPAEDLSPGTLGGSKPRSSPDQSPAVEHSLVPLSTDEEVVSQGEGSGMHYAGMGVGRASGESTPLCTLPATSSRSPFSDQPSKAGQLGKEESRDSSVVSGHNNLGKVGAPDQAHTNHSGVNLQEASGQSVLCRKDEVGMREAGSAISIQHMDPSEHASLRCGSLPVGHIRSTGDGPNCTSLGFSPVNSPALGTDVSRPRCNLGLKPSRSSLETLQTHHASKCALPKVRPAEWCMQRQGGAVAWDKASGSSFPPVLSKVQSSLPANLLRPNIALPAWAQRMKHGGLEASGPVRASALSGKMSPASPASIQVTNPPYPPQGNKVEGSGKSPGSGAFPGTVTSAPIGSQVEESSCRTTRDPDSAYLDLNILQPQGSRCGNANADPNHSPLGFSPDIPQVQGCQGSNANVDPHHKPLGFRPDLPQVQGSPCRAVNLDSSYKLLGFCQDSFIAQGSLNHDVCPGPEQYQIHSDDDDCSPKSDAEDYLCWEQFWVDLHEPPQDWSSVNAGPGILRVPVHELGAQARRSSTARVTWHVPLEISSICSPENKTAKLDLSTGPFCVGRPIASQVPGSSISFLPTLACTFMYRLLTLPVSQAQEIRRNFQQPASSLLIPGAGCWRPLPYSFMQSALSAPSRPQSTSIPRDTLPGCTSVSGDDSGNMLVLTCIKARWGEASSPDSSFQNSQCVELGGDPSPNFVGFSPQHDLCEVAHNSVGFSPQHDQCEVAHNSVRFSPRHDPCEVAPSSFGLSPQSSLADDAPSHVRRYPTLPSVTLGAQEVRQVTCISVSISQKVRQVTCISVSISQKVRQVTCISVSISQKVRQVTCISVSISQKVRQVTCISVSISQNRQVRCISVSISQKVRQVTCIPVSIS